jgi:AGZA family xanthine/uracil permease-like MFS transporter
MLSYVLVKVLTGRFKEVSVVLFVLAAFFVLKYIAPLL